MSGIEKRKFKRINVDMTLNISNLFKQDNVTIKNVEAPIHVENISKSGIGFVSSNILPVGYYFNAKLKLGDETSTLYTVVRIIRSQCIEGSDEMYYGCEFIGLAPILEYIFDNFEAQVLENQ